MRLLCDAHALCYATRMRCVTRRACACYALCYACTRCVTRAFICAPAVLRRACYAMCYARVTRLAVLPLGRHVHIAQDSKVLLIKPFWSNKIFAADESERKTLEIRSTPVTHRGRVYVCESGSYFITGMFELTDCEGPLSEERWNQLRNEHKVPGSRAYGASTYAWSARKPCRLSAIPCAHSSQVKFIIWRHAQFKR